MVEQPSDEARERLMAYREMFAARDAVEATLNKPKRTLDDVLLSAQAASAILGRIEAMPPARTLEARRSVARDDEHAGLFR